MSAAGDGAALLARLRRSETEVGARSWSAGVCWGLCYSPFSVWRWGDRGKNQWSCWRPSSGSARRSHSHSSLRFLLLSIPQLDPFSPFFISHSASNGGPPSFCCPEPVSHSPFLYFLPRRVRATTLVRVGHVPVWMQKSVAGLECAAYDKSWISWMITTELLTVITHSRACTLPVLVLCAATIAHSYHLLF